MSEGGRVLRAVRGAITVDADEPALVREGTVALLHEMLHRNALAADDLVSILFTTTEDLSSEFPAVGAREIGLAAVPLLCAREIPVPGSMPRCIRALIHCYAPEGRPIRHAYLREARQLRMDLPE